MTDFTKDTFTIYHDQFQGGYTETLVQETAVFNENSNGAIVLTRDDKLGDYYKETMFKLVADLVSRRDVSSLSAATDLDLTNAELAEVKLNRMIGPVKKTIDALKKIGKDPATFSFVMGQQIAKAVIVDQVNSALRALVAAIGGTSALVYDGTSGTMTHSALAYGKGKMGDQAPMIGLWVMYSTVATALEVQAISDKITNVADGVINFGRVGALGLPALIIDSSSLVLATTPTTYATLGLKRGACRVTESEETTMAMQLITGLKNLAYRIQGEAAYNLGVEGYTWDVTNGGANPTDAAVATSTNWDQVVTSHKDCAGVMVKTK